MNLIDNAVKFGPRGGLIRMRLIEEDGSVLFTIDNEGKSIPGEDKSRIFNKFYQGDSSHESEGNGLGLALVRKIVAIHGGEVWVEDYAILNLNSRRGGFSPAQYPCVGLLSRDKER